MEAYLKLQQWGARTGSDIATEVIPDQRIAALEHRYGIILPPDFRQYLSSSSPVSNAWDSEMVIWWNFERIRNIPDEYSHELKPIIAKQPEKYLFFADYCIWCWAWAISCTDDETRGKVAFIGSAGHDKFVADSFSDFVGKYVHDWHSVS